MRKTDQEEINLKQLKRTKILIKIHHLLRIFACECEFLPNGLKVWVCDWNQRQMPRERDHRSKHLCAASYLSMNSLGRKVELSYVFRFGNRLSSHRVNHMRLGILNRKQFGCILSETGEKQRTNNNQNRSTEQLIRNGRKLNLETILTRQFIFGKF